MLVIEGGNVSLRNIRWTNLLVERKLFSKSY